MATFVLIPGAGSDSWYWHLVVPRLEARGHTVVTPDLPSGDDGAGLAEYADAVVTAVGEAVGDGGDLVVVGQSMGAFTAPLVCDRLPVRMLVLVAAMVPAPGESPGEWWENTGHAAARRDQAERDGRAAGEEEDLASLFFHDVPADVAAEAMRRPGKQSGTPFEKPWPLDKWPDVPTRVLLCRQDRLFPAAFQRRVVAERLGIRPDEMDSGHLPALSQPADLAARLHGYAEEA